ncbi:hypothetical protein ACYCAX_19155 [Pseudomonas sp. MT3]|uniref:hypothetical protein n=1 Tax=Pseudomonas sp. ATCC 13867 TaxID=1294143 RepID=UPI0002C4E9B6|nr:hypothetical protein [Pseudomonas sp. ATCC 13867]AGI23131.1 hypothetical protein H681_06255 [Pseudomonas sp. ATCC 13867]RFQ37091.1 hypothetical protein D0N87_08025 [Pseudomonas sp. ATCC 13867]
MSADLEAVLDRNALSADCQTASWQSFADFNGGVRPLVQDVSVSGRYRAFVVGDQRITIVRNGPTLVYSQCRDGLFGYNFDVDEPLLLGSIRGAGELMKPIHLKFSQPVSKVGACLSANGNLGDYYIASLKVRLDNGLWFRLVAPAVALSQQRGSAPVLGARTGNGRSIDEVKFDLIDANNTGQFKRVAVGRVYFL